MSKIVLASQSPRRRELLKQMGISDFEIIPSDCDEKLNGNLTPYEQVQELARQKARNVAQKCNSDDVVIAADTIVVLDNRILGKPKSKTDAFKMLSDLSGRQHVVLTGVAVIANNNEIVEAEATKVNFVDMTAEQIEQYIKTGEPMDKAGAYGIQGRAGVFISGIEGDYFNVVGLPICRLNSILKRLNAIGK